MRDDELPDDLADARDVDIAARLRAMHRVGTPVEVEALRARVRGAAAFPLAQRRRQATSWLDATSAIGRFAVPIGLAAAVLCIVLVRAQPGSPVRDDPSSLLAYGLGADATLTLQVADQLLLPASADAMLLGVQTVASRDSRDAR